MISLWIAVLAVAALALLPFAISVFGARRVASRGRREAALALHRAQLAELDRELAEGRIAPREHSAAVLEVQRRLLQAAESPEPVGTGSGNAPLWAALVLVPTAAVLLYLAGGQPDMPAMPLKERLEAVQQRVQEQAALIVRLRAVLSGMDPKSEKARDGYILLGNAEARLGNMPAAAAAWKTALAAQFDSTLAVETAEAITEAEGKMTGEAAELFRRALKEGDPNAPWRPMARKRLDQPVSTGNPPATAPPQAGSR